MVINCKNYLRILNKQLRTTDLLVKNCKYKFGLPRKTRTIVNVLKSTHIQILTAINRLEPNNRRSQGLARGNDAPPPPPPPRKMCFFLSQKIFLLLSQLNRLKVVPHPAPPPPIVELFSSLGTMYRQLHTLHA